MATIGQILIDVQMQTARFNEGARQINANLGRIDRNFTTTFASIQRTAYQFAGVIATVAGARGLGLLVTNSIHAADNIGKTADKIGIGIEALQEWRFIAEQSGLETRALDLAVQRFGRRMGEAAEFGQGELKPALDKLNISVRNNDGSVRSINSVLTEFLAKIGSVGDVSVRNALAMKAFDTEGVAMVNVAAQGAAGMEKLRATAHEMGIVLGEDLVRNAEKMNDQMNVATRAIGSELTRAFLDLAPLIVQASEGIAIMTSRLVALGKQIGILSRTRAEALRVELDETNRRIIELTDFIYAAEHPTGNIFERFAKGALVFQGSIDAARTKVEELRDRVRQLTRELEGLSAPGPTRPGGRAGGAAKEPWYPRTYLGPTAREAEDASMKALQIFQQGEEAKLEAAKAYAEAELQIVQDRLLAEADLLRTQAERDIEEKIDLLRQGAMTEDQFNEYRRDRYIELEESLTEVSQREASKRLAVEQQWAKAMVSTRRNALGSAVEFLQALSSKSKGAAIAAIALEKGLRIAETIMSTHAAAVRALAELGPIAGPPVAAAITTWGYAQAALIGATGLVQAAGVGGGGAALGSVSNPVFTTGGNEVSAGPAPVSTSQTNVSITLEGRSYDRDQVIELIDAINDAVGDGVRIIAA